MTLAHVYALHAAFLLTVIQCVHENKDLGTAEVNIYIMKLKLVSL